MKTPLTAKFAQALAADDDELQQLVELYGRRKRRRTLLGLLGLREDTETELTPGVDSMGQRMDARYFSSDWTPGKSMVRTNGPDPLGRWHGTEEDGYGTIYSR